MRKFAECLLTALAVLFFLIGPALGQEKPPAKPETAGPVFSLPSDAAFHWQEPPTKLAAPPLTLSAEQAGRLRTLQTELQGAAKDVDIATANLEAARGVRVALLQALETFRIRTLAAAGIKEAEFDSYEFAVELDQLVLRRKSPKPLATGGGK